jgi:hypothetical protein
LAITYRERQFRLKVDRRLPGAFYRALVVDGDDRAGAGREEIAHGQRARRGPANRACIAAEQQWIDQAVVRERDAREPVSVTALPLTPGNVLDDCAELFSDIEAVQRC